MTLPEGVQFVLMDIEGTITDIAFVHQTLFPYAKAHLPQYVYDNLANTDVQACLDKVSETLHTETGLSEGKTLEAQLAALAQWMAQDRKHPALKTLQGLVWEAGYQSGAFQGHLYPDVLPTWRAWCEAGIKLGIYSSGSVYAQKLLLSHSVEGDVTPFISAYFDTTVGPKQDPGSYQQIQTALTLNPQSILFLSDIPEELLAAKQAGLKAIQVNRGHAGFTVWSGPQIEGLEILAR